MSRTTLAVEIVGLHKRYDDGADALRGVDLRVPAGGIFALLGRNGSGKTTTVRIMVGLTSSTAAALSDPSGADGDRPGECCEFLK